MGDGDLRTPRALAVGVCQMVYKIDGLLGSKTRLGALFGDYGLMPGVGDRPRVQLLLLRRVLDWVSEEYAASLELCVELPVAESCGFT